MGVKLFKLHIENAEVSSLHPSKVIPLSKGYTASFAIRELAKINLHQKFDLTKITFQNNGESLQIYSNRHSVVLYDKIRDLIKPTKRAIDKDPTKQQFSIFEYLEKQKRLELLKFEVRLSHKTKMKQVLAEIGFTGTPLFKDIFKKDICQKTLKLYWNKFFAKDLFLFSPINSPQKILQSIFMAYPKTKPRTAIFLMGLLLLCKDDAGIRGLRKILEAFRPKSSWQALKKYLDSFENKIFATPLHGFIKDIEKSLDDLTPFKLKKPAKKLSTCNVNHCKVY